MDFFITDGETPGTVIQKRQTAVMIPGTFSVWASADMQKIPFFEEGWETPGIVFSKNQTQCEHYAGKQRTQGGAVV